MELDLKSESPDERWKLSDSSPLEDLRRGINMIRDQANQPLSPHISIIVVEREP